jgi:hypothetical protein
MAEVGEQSGQPGGDLSRDLGGEWRGELGLFIGGARGRNGRPLTRIEGGLIGEGSVTGGISGWSLKTTGSPDMWGPVVSEGESGRGTGSGEGLDGPRAPFPIWAEGFPESLSSFFLF